MDHFVRHISATSASSAVKKRFFVLSVTSVASVVDAVEKLELPVYRDARTTLVYYGSTFSKNKPRNCPGLTAGTSSSNRCGRSGARRETSA